MAERSRWKRSNGRLRRLRQAPASASAGRGFFTRRPLHRYHGRVWSGSPAPPGRLAQHQPHVPQCSWRSTHHCRQKALELARQGRPVRVRPSLPSHTPSIRSHPVLCTSCGTSFPRRRRSRSSRWARFPGFANWCWVSPSRSHCWSWWPLRPEQSSSARAPSPVLLFA